MCLSPVFEGQGCSPPFLVCRPVPYVARVARGERNGARRGGEGGGGHWGDSNRPLICLTDRFQYIKIQLRSEA